MINKSFYLKLIKDAQSAGIFRYVVAAVIAKGNPQILLLKRPKGDFMGGIYELPSGEVETDETIHAALEREITEETGLEIKEVQSYLGYFDYRVKSGQKTRQFNFAVSVFEPFRITLQEHEDFAWVNQEQSGNYPITDNVKRILNLFWRPQ